MSIFATIDPIIERWAKENALVLQREFAGRESRFVYISSPRGDCFQIFAHPFSDNHIKVEAWTVETRDGREMSRQWAVTPADLGETLQTALQTVRDWF